MHSLLHPYKYDILRTNHTCPKWACLDTVLFDHWKGLKSYYYLKKPMLKQKQYQYSNHAWDVGPLRAIDVIFNAIE